jgi:NADH-quinone oxidoreductase subunit L
VAGFSTLLALLAITLAYLIYGRTKMKKGEPDPLRRILGPIFVGMHNKWWVDELYDLLIIRPYVALAAFFADIVDWRFWHDWFHDSVLARSFRGLAWWLSQAFDLKVIDGIANGLADVTKGVAARLRTLQTGYVRNYALSVLAGVLLVLGYFLIR